MLCRKFRYRTDQLPVAYASHHAAWRCSDDDALPSLDDVLTSLPIDLGLNLEVKMATPASLERTSPAEIERMTQPIVAALERDARCRPEGNIVISSFDPDICTEMKRKLKSGSLASIPVMLLTTGGIDFHVDPRRMSIAGAIDFCREHGLDGLVVDTSQLRAQSHLIKVACRHHLQMMTYGLENDDMDWLTEQWRLGIHGAIVDNVQQVVPQFHRRMENLRKCDPSSPVILPSITLT